MITITRSADIFIIPNMPMVPCKEMIFQPSTKGGPNPSQNIIDSMTELCQLNGREWDPNDPLVEVWYRNPESDNIAGHGLTLTIDDVESGKGKAVYDMRPKTSRYLPASFLKDVEEGGTIQIKIPVRLHVYGTKTGPSGVWDATLTARQNTSRYRTFGGFPRVLQSCLRDANVLYHNLPDHHFQPDEM